MRPSAESLLTEWVMAQRDKGIPIDRASTSIRTLHPDVFVRNVVWTEEGGARVRLRTHDILAEPTFIGSPVADIYAGAGRIRCRLDDGEEQRYALTTELAREGYKDYVAFPLELGDGRRSFLSFATQATSGFTDDQLKSLEMACGPFANAVAIESAEFALESLLEVYLGPNAAKRVLAGGFRRGGGETLRAAIWNCDLRGFTRLADTREPGSVVYLLDRYFDAVGAAIEASGGEILKFVGDAVLAVFTHDDPALSTAEADRVACERALAAAKLALQNMESLDVALRAKGLPELEMGIALHHGEIFYGNIGAARRLDFTVIGAAVNETCRVEPLCKALSTPLLVTDAFVAHLGRTREELVSRGVHELRGSAAPRELFTLGTLVAGSST